MSRAFTIVVILLLMVIVALVPRMGTEEPGLGLGDGYAYREDTLARFRLLLEDENWTLADPPRNPQGMLEAVHERTGLTFVLIPAGEFMMGSPEDEEGRPQYEDWLEDEGPLRRVSISSFLLCKTECTQRAWMMSGGKNHSKLKGAGLPVEQVSWTECREWSVRNGLRLPSEAEWEYSCRAGTRTPYSTGSMLTTDLANYQWKRGQHRGDPKGKTRWQSIEAGSLPANPWGLHEMHGNVREWCEDRDHPNYKDAPTDGSAWTAGDTTLRVVRGGGWGHWAQECRSASRESDVSGGYLSNLGFRPVASLPPLEKPDGD